MKLFIYFSQTIVSSHVGETIHLLFSKNGASAQENYRKPIEVVRPCEENERGAHSDKNARCGLTMEEKKRVTKPKMERCLKERYDRGGTESGQRDKQGSMEKDANQTYMTGQARDEGAKKINH